MIFRRNFYLFGFRFRRKYVCIYIVLLFYLVWCRREAGGVALALSHHHPHLLNKESWRRRMEEIVIRLSRLDSDMPAYETKVVNEMLQILTFLQPESPAHILASLLVPPVNPEIEVIEPVKILSIKVAKPKTSFLQR